VSNFIFNSARGRVVELYRGVKNNNPANSAFVVIPLQTSGLASDATLMDMTTVAEVFAGTTLEQTTMGRKVLTDVDLPAIPAPDNTLNKIQLSLPGLLWAAASGPAISKMLVCYDPDITIGTDSTLEPLMCFDYVATPSGVDLQTAAGLFYEALSV
jgi:uncharacterized membrane protein